MPNFRMPLVSVCLALVVASCAADPKPTVRLVETKPPIPAEAKKPCRAPVVIPDADLTEDQVFRGWNRDRESLIECEKRRALAVGE